MKRGVGIEGGKNVRGRTRLGRICGQGGGGVRNGTVGSAQIGADCEIRWKGDGIVNPQSRPRRNSWGSSSFSGSPPMVALKVLGTSPPKPTPTVGLELGVKPQSWMR